MRIRTRDIDAISVLGVVLFLSLTIGIVVLAYHSLWRGSSRTLFSVQEHRQLISLARSSLAEGYFRLQTQLDQGSSRWFDWLTTRGKAQDRTLAPDRTRQYADRLTANPAALRYTTSDLSIRRVQGLDTTRAASARLGILDIRVCATVVRAAPRHEVGLTMVERRSFWFSDSAGPFGRVSRRVEVSSNPVATWIEGEE